MSEAPLDGITVVSIEQAVAAPYATRQLADLGARVIKVERPGVGDFARSYDHTVRGESSYFVWANRSKESICLDFKEPDGLAILNRLIGEADVFVQNLAPGAADRLALDGASLQRRWPRLIVCDVSGYGRSGPWAHRKAYDLLVQAETGLLSLTGSPEQPAKVGISIADIAAGMYAFSGILTALLRRATTGLGSIVEVSLFESLAEWMGPAAYFTEYSGRPPRRTGTHHATIAPYGPFVCADGVPIVLAVQNEREWAALCANFLHQPELISEKRFESNSSRVYHREDLYAIVAERFAALDSVAAVSALDAIGIANARQNGVQELLQHPVLAARDRWRTIESPGGPIRALLPPVTLSGTEPVMGPVPAIGQHTEAILAELGYADSVWTNLVERGVV